MADIPLLERLAQLPALPATAAVALLERLAQPHTDPVIGAFFGVDDDGDAVVNALLPTVLQQFQTKRGQGATAWPDADVADEGRQVFADRILRLGPAQRRSIMTTDGTLAKYRDIFEKRAFAHVATVDAGGAPQITPVWVDFDGKYIRFNTARGRVKDKNLQRHPHVALAAQDPDHPYRYVQVRGRAALTEQRAEARRR